ncbi:uncharacterized protein LOC118267544 [Spodoptera frugiperda]|uniref:Uncharacterized protein LOC118267544 n=1 Tax=Spodoptera frugiperda TaxID=7108 RepID=A0A9R0EJE5_SPOFR|nr:uncharacterized protein LOC118267544 [Spodoptera frugiperda]
MRTELPTCRRCCFCLPLRYGLLSWGYFRFVISGMFLVGLTIGFVGLVTAEDSYRELGSIIVVGILLLSTLTDFVLNFLFILGGHKKDVRLLKSYYVYSIVLCVLTILLGTTSSVHTVMIFKMTSFDLSFFFWVILADMASFIAQVLIQIYFLLLVRSEIIKLRSNCEFRFVNLASEGECTLKCTEIGLNNEEGRIQ